MKKFAPLIAAALQIAVGSILFAESRKVPRIALMGVVGIFLIMTSLFTLCIMDIVTDDKNEKVK